MRASTGTAVSIGRTVASQGAIYSGSSRGLGWFDRHFAMATVSPAIIVSLLVFGLPLAFSLWISFQGWSVQQSLLGGRFVGAQNYADLFADPAFVASIWRTFIYTGTTVAAELGFGLAIAMLLNLDLPFIGIFRTALIVPMMMTPIVAALCWKMLLDPQYGIIDYLIGSPIVFHTAPPQPASKARMICSPQLVGGADASQNGFGHWMPQNVVASVGLDMLAPQPRGDADRNISHMPDAGVGNQALHILLGKGNQ